MSEPSLERRTLGRIAVYCGSATGTDPAYERAAVALGRAMTARRIGLVYGGGGVGLMGAISRIVYSTGGEVIGVIPHALMKREIGNFDVTQLIQVNTMHERKRAMAEAADAFIALPGGLGTFEEFFESATWNQLGVHSKPIGLLDVRGYFEHLLMFLDRAVDDGLLKAKYRDMIVVERSPESLLDALSNWRPPEALPWESATIANVVP
jgi:hypothetical protein